MSEHARKHRTERVPVRIGKSRPILIPREAVMDVRQAVIAAIRRARDTVPAIEVFPELKDPIKGPAAVLRGFRKMKDLTQAELAEKLGITQADLSNMEKGRRVISKKMAEKLAEVFKTSYRVFL